MLPEFQDLIPSNSNWQNGSYFFTDVDKVTSEGKKIPCMHSVRESSCKHNDKIWFPDDPEISGNDKFME